MQISKADLEDQELLAKLEEMYTDHTTFDDTIKEMSIDREILKDGIKLLSDTIGPTTERVEIFLDVEGKRGWDAQIKRSGGGIDVGLLEALKGKTLFNKLLCNRVTTYEFSQEKLDLALREGLLTEEELQKCTIEPKLTRALTRR